MRHTAPSPRHHAAKRRYKYHRRHTVHYYLVIAGVAAASLVCILNFIGYRNGSIRLAEWCFACIVLTNTLISMSFFWGFFMVMNGHIPVKRLKVLLPHAAVGVLSPLLYTLNISINLESLGVQPVSGLSLACSVACVSLLAVQWTMGRAIVRPEPIHAVLRVFPDPARGALQPDNSQFKIASEIWRSKLREEKDS